MSIFCTLCLNLGAFVHSQNHWHTLCFQELMTYCFQAIHKVNPSSHAMLFASTVCSHFVAQVFIRCCGKWLAEHSTLAAAGIMTDMLLMTDDSISMYCHEC